MNKKRLFYAVLNTVVNVLFFFALIIMMFTEIINYSIVVTVLSPIGFQPEPGTTFNFVSVILDIYLFVSVFSIAGTWVTYYKKSKKYFNLFIGLTWGFIIMTLLVYFILYLSRG